MSDLRLRQIARYHYRDPHDFLRKLREVEPMIASSHLDYRVRSLHTRKLRPANEQRQAALFACGMADRIPDFQFAFSHGEDSDYDAMIRWRRENEEHYTPLQLKEFVPPELNSKCTLENVVAGLKKYADSRDLVAAVFLNRRLIGFNIADYTLPPLNLAGLYLFGAAAPDQSRWHMIGDLLNHPRITTFDYPKPETSSEAVSQAP